jgi:hypothetical protein
MEIRLPSPHASPTSATTLVLALTAIDEAPLIRVTVGVSPEDGALQDKLQVACDAKLGRSKSSDPLCSVVELIAALEKALRV